jgi:hypothetical protein
LSSPIHLNHSFIPPENNNHRSHPLPAASPSFIHSPGKYNRLIKKKMTAYITGSAHKRRNREMETSEKQIPKLTPNSGHAMPVVGYGDGQVPGHTGEDETGLSGLYGGWVPSV